MAKSALVYTNDPKHKELRIRIEGNVEQIFEADPKDIFTIFTQPGQPFKQTIVLTNNLEDPVIVTGLNHNLGKIAKVDFKTLEKGRKYEVNISGQIDKPMTKGGLIRLDLLDAPLKSLKLRAFINIRDSAPKGQKVLPDKKPEVHNKS